jgi:hypothetical protein
MSGKYPHLLPIDGQLWNEYRERFQPQHSDYFYDVAVGEGRDPGPDYADRLRMMGIRLSRRRIDVVGINSDRLDIFEITQSAGLKAAGQALTYPELLRHTWQTSLPIKMIVICRTVQTDMSGIFELYGADLVILPKDGRPPEDHGETFSGSAE